MGIRGLETFIRQNPHENIAEDIDIREEIEKWRDAHSTNPTIIINLGNFVKVLANLDRNGPISGGQYNKATDKFDHFFAKLRELNVNLVFFCRPFLHNIKEELVLDAYDCIVQNGLDWFQKSQAQMGNQFPWHLDKRFLYNLISICARYGTVYTHLNEIYSKIITYTREHSDVLAMIQHDTDFLLFGGDYQYWSLADLDILQLKTKKYSSTALLNRLQLNIPQSQMLSAISRLEGDVIPDFCRNIDTQEPQGRTMFKLASYIKQLDNLEPRIIAADIFGQNGTSEQLAELKHNLARFDQSVEWKDELNGLDANFLEFVSFCQQQLYFAYGLAVEKFLWNQALTYIDLRRLESTRFIDQNVILLLRMCGIIFKDHLDRPETRSIKIKREINEEAIKREEKILYPSMNLPTLQQLIIQEDDESFANERWALFQWMLDLDEETFANIKHNPEMADNKFMRIVLYTLLFLLSKRFITVREVDIILLTEWNGQPRGIRNTNTQAPPSNGTERANGHGLPNSNNQPIPVVQNAARTPLFVTNWRDHTDFAPVSNANASGTYRPNRLNTGNHYYYQRNRSNYERQNRIPNPRNHKYIEGTWIQTANKYTITFEMVCHCLELCGLRKETDLIRFDASEFHAKMRQDRNSRGDIDNMLTRIKNIRFY